MITGDHKGTAAAIGMTLPITPIQILWINLITAVTLGLSLAFEPTEENTMRRPPRPRNEPLLTGDLGKAARGTKVVWATVIGITAAQFTITYLLPLQGIFSTRPVPFFDGVLIVAVGVSLFAIIETEKQLRLRLRELRPPPAV
jgi:magnesium-transporting ATPase (P-type)